MSREFWGLTINWAGRKKKFFSSWFHTLIWTFLFVQFSRLWVTLTWWVFHPDTRSNLAFVMQVQHMLSNVHAGCCESLKSRAQPDINLTCTCTITCRTWRSSLGLNGDIQHLKVTLWAKYFWPLLYQSQMGVNQRRWLTNITVWITTSSRKVVSAHV